VTGGWGSPRKRPPSDDPERPPKGPGSGSLANPNRITIDIRITNATALELADAPDEDD
jgi:hypothetical protein